MNGYVNEMPSDELGAIPSQQDAQSSSSNGPVRRNPFHESIDMISSGGLGHNSSSPPPWSPTPSTTATSQVVNAIEACEKTLSPFQKRSLSGIALRAFLLGGVFFFSSSLALYTATQTTSPLWRLPFFLSSLSLFHFLEFYTTALTNPTNAQTSSFLLSTNGWAYNVAHTAAFTECLLSHIFRPRELFPLFHIPILWLGFSLVLVGQIIRMTAILQAGPSFSHLVAQRKKEKHVLITHGVYSILRHPSYFGFFWWGIGTQVVLGNVICLIAYTVVLWRFFSARIQGEEVFLVQFFKQEYVDYRKRTPVGIPYIR